MTENILPLKKRLGRPPATDNQEQVILEAAAALFAGKGYEAATLNDVCVAVGLSKAAIYHYFPSKSALYDRVILATLKRMADRLHSIVDEEATPPAKLKSLVVAQCEFLESDAFGLIVVFEATKMMNQDLRPEAQAFMQDYEDMIGRIISAGIEDGSFANVDVDVARKTIIGMLSWMAKWFKPGGTPSASAIAQQFLHILTNGLAPRG